MRAELYRGAQIIGLLIAGKGSSFPRPPQICYGRGTGR